MINTTPGTPAEQSTEQRLQSIKQRVEQGREAKARAEATLEQLEAQRQEALQQLQALGVDEANLANEIQTLETTIQQKLAEAEAALAAPASRTKAWPK